MKLISVLVLLLGLLVPRGAVAAAKPNIVYILADDLGYGDVHCLNPNGRIPTPHLDRLAAEGMIFTDAHSSSAVCTPSRYGLLTGRYNWRSRLKSGVQGGMSPPLIEEGRWTVPAFLKANGYHTACIGKWHLGMEWTLQPGAKPFDDLIEKGTDGWRVDFRQEIGRGPNSAGFDYFFGLAASLDMVPYAFIENHRVTSLPTMDKAFPMMAGRTNGMTRKGPAAPGFDAVEVLPTLVRRAVDYLEQRGASAKRGEPFFLYLPLNAPHTPILPTREWQGRSGLNPYADFVMETDAEVGKVLAALDRLGLTKNTLVFLGSDNGCSPEARFEELIPRGHNPSGPLRGAKADIFDGGHRIPFLARWPGHIRGGSVSDQLVCLNDLFATCAEILGQGLPENAGEDSVSLLPVLEGRATQPVREALVHHSIDGTFAIRRGSWKLELGPDSGGWSAPLPGSAEARGLPGVQLYDLSRDIGERTNAQAAHPEIVGELTKLLEKYVADGRSTPGRVQSNTTPVEILQKRSRSAARPTRPNIIFIIADDLGWRDLGCYGSTFYETPHLDRLAATGMRFTQAYAACSVCSPTRASILSGKYPARLHLTDWLPGRPDRPDQKLRRPSFAGQLGLEEVTLAEAFKESGWSTAFLGKWHLGGEAFFPEHQGFDLNIGGCEKGAPPSYFSPYQIPNLRDGPAGEYLTDRLTDEALKYIEGAKDHPFLLYLSHYAVHNPQQAKPALVEKYRAKLAGRGPTEEPEFIVDHGRRVRRVQNSPIYAAMIESLDESVGRILDKLTELKLDERTILVFTSDNGGLSTSEGTPTSNQPLRMGKGWHYEGGVREPLLVRWPGVTQGGAICEEPMISMDYYPTLLEMAGLPARPQQHVDGVSFTRLLAGGVRDERPLFWHYPHYSNQGGGPGGAVRLGDYKLIEWFEDMHVELYNLRADPGEREDLASKMPEKAAVLREQLHSWRQAVGAQMMTVNSEYRPGTDATGDAPRRP
jgi:arylsulfatase A